MSPGKSLLLLIRVHARSAVQIEVAAPWFSNYSYILPLELEEGLALAPSPFYIT